MPEGRWIPVVRLQAGLPVTGTPVLPVEGAAFPIPRAGGEI